MKLFLEIILVCYLTSFVNSNQNFRYEKMHRFGLGRRIPNFHLLNRKTYEYPQPLPSPATRKPPNGLQHQPYPSLYQGTKTRDDVRVFRKAFSYPATPVGHRILCDNLVDCTMSIGDGKRAPSDGRWYPITYMSIETKDSIPIILRGGAGYRHFTVIVRANAWEPLEGIIRAYCRRKKEPKL